MNAGWCVTEQYANEHTKLDEVVLEICTTEDEATDALDEKAALIDQSRMDWELTSHSKLDVKFESDSQFGYRISRTLRVREFDLAMPSGGKLLFVEKRAR